MNTDDLPRQMTEGGMRAIEQGLPTREVIAHFHTVAGRDAVTVEFPLFVWEHIVRSLMISRCETCESLSEMFYRGFHNTRGIVVGRETRNEGERITFTYAE